MENTPENSSNRKKLLEIARFLIIFSGTLGAVVILQMAGLI